MLVTVVAYVAIYGVCLVVVMLAPTVVVVGNETVGHRHLADVMERVLG